MSNDITKLCRPLQMGPAQKAVLMCLADRAQDDGRAWPSLPSISEWTCLQRTAVIKALKGLEATGYVDIQRAAGRGNTMTIALSRISAVDQSATRTGVPDEPVRDAHHHPSATRTTPVRDADGTSTPRAPGSIKKHQRSINEASKGSARANKWDISSLVVQFPELADVDRQALQDWIEVRKGKKATVTASALKQLANEAQKAGVSIAQAVEFCAGANWQGFNAKWYQQRQDEGGLNKQEALDRGNNAVARRFAKQQHNFSTMNYREGINDDGTLV